MMSIEDSMITFRKDLQSLELSSEDGRPIYENIGTSYCPNDLLEDVADSLTILSLDSNSLISQEEEEDLLADSLDRNFSVEGSRYFNLELLLLLYLFLIELPAAPSSKSSSSS